MCSGRPNTPRRWDMTQGCVPFGPLSQSASCERLVDLALILSLRLTPFLPPPRKLDFFFPSLVYSFTWQQVKGGRAEKIIFHADKTLSFFWQSLQRFAADRRGKVSERGRQCMEWQQRSTMKQVAFVMLWASVKADCKMQITVSLSANVIKKPVLGHITFNLHTPSPAISTEKVPLIC